MTATEISHSQKELVKAVIDTTFTWDYERTRPALGKLYEKAKTSQWNVTTDLDWSADVDPEKVAAELSGGTTSRFRTLQEIEDSPVKHFGEKEWTEVGIQMQNSLLSQFLHGEQGALLCTARIVETVPWIDAKYYASTQVMDEARHVEVFAKYLDEKLTSQYKINDNLKSLLNDILADSRWDITYLGMQIMVEGLALAAFGMMQTITNEPLLKQLLRYVMADEARHVAFGVLSLQEYYKELSDAEMRERQEFAFDAACRLQQRFMQSEVWERMGVDPQAVRKALDANNPPVQQAFQQMLFSKIVPNCKKLGLLDAADGWLRERFTETGVIQFEDWTDTGEEYADLDAVAQDRGTS
ncbi:MAG: ferritin-like domain-containing protein [Acidimicrobiia bacterium]